MGMLGVGSGGFGSFHIHLGQPLTQRTYTEGLSNALLDNLGLVQSPVHVGGHHLNTLLASATALAMYQDPLRNLGSNPLCGAQSGWQASVLNKESMLHGLQMRVPLVYMTSENGVRARSINSGRLLGPTSKPGSTRSLWSPWSLGSLGSVQVGGPHRETGRSKGSAKHPVCQAPTRTKLQVERQLG